MTTRRTLNLVTMTDYMERQTTCFLSLVKYRLSPDIIPSLFKKTCSPSNEVSNDVTKCALFSHLMEIQMVRIGLGTVI